jgi:hypothetical protein
MLRRAPRALRPELIPEHECPGARMRLERTLNRRIQSCDAGANMTMQLQVTACSLPGPGDQQSTMCLPHESAGDDMTQASDRAVQAARPCW